MRWLSEVRAPTSAFAVICFHGACPAPPRVLPSLQPLAKAVPMVNTETQTVVTDLTISFSSSSDEDAALVLAPGKWQRIEKDLFLHSAETSAWLNIAQAKDIELHSEDFVVTCISIGKIPSGQSSNGSWESRPGGIWISRKSFDGDIDKVITGIDVLFGEDAIDPRPQWNIVQDHLLLDSAPELPVARLSVRHGKAEPIAPPAALRVKKKGTFKIVQISDTHMVTGVGSCKDAIDSNGHFLPESVADPLTVKFLEDTLDTEKPDLVILTGDQVHHDIPDTQSALFKVVAPMIERFIPYAAVFGNHDSEGVFALSRKQAYHRS
jgi:hypothetical protein